MENTATDTLSTKKRPSSYLSRILRRFKEESPFAIGSIPFIWQILFFFLPIATILTTAVVKLADNGQFHSISFEAFRHILTPSYFMIAMNSLYLAASTTIGCLLIGFPLAYFIAFHSGRLKRILLFLLIIPFWTNFILHIYAWFFVLEKNGFLNNLLMNIGVITSPLHILNSGFAILIMMIYFYLPFMVLPIFSSLERFNINHLEASLDLGANRCQTICRILLPLTKNAIKSGIFLVFIPAFGEFVIPEIMGGDKISFIGNVISIFVFNKATVAYGIAYTILCTMLLFLVLFLLSISINRLSVFLAGGRK